MRERASIGDGYVDHEQKLETVVCQMTALPFRLGPRGAIYIAKRGQ